MVQLDIQAHLVQWVEQVLLGTLEQLVNQVLLDPLVQLVT